MNMENTRKLFLILEAELFEFRGFSKPRIKLMTAEFKQKLQILNSTNGCGKSTFISELNPFAINKTLFKKNGYKRIKFQYGDKVYEVYSSQKTNKLMDLDEPTVNICTGGTISQLQTLVSTMFGITPFSWAIAMGSMEFTSSNKEARRKWIELISGIDLDYPFKILGKLSSNITQTRGVVKLLNSQAATESNKLLKFEDVQEAIELKDILTSNVKDILMAQDSSSSNVGHVELLAKIKRLETTANTLYTSYGKLVTIINPFSKLTTIEAVMEANRDAKALVEKITVEINGTILLQEDKASLLAKIEEAGKVDIGKINDEIDYHTECLNQARGRCKDGSRLINQYVRDTETAMELSGIISKPIFNFSDMVMDLSLEESSFELLKPEDYIMQLRGRVKDQVQAIESSSNTITYYSELLQHLKDDCRDVECTSCHTTFPLGGDRITDGEGKIELAKGRLLKQEKELEVLTEELTNLEVVYGSRIKAVNYLKGLLRDYPWFVSNLSELINEGIGLTELGRNIERAGSQAYYISVGIESSKELARLKNIKDSYETVSKLTDGEALDREVDDLSKKITTLRQRRRAAEEDVVSTADLTTLAKQHITQISNIKSVLEELDSCRRSYLKVMDNHILSTMEKDLQIKLATVTKKVNDNDILVTLVEKLNSMLDDANERYDIYRTLDKALNTSTGIIGEQLVGYTKAFANQVSEAIDQLWGYPMKVLPCDVEGRKGMNYQFPFDVGGDEPVPDIANGSKSQKSVINLAVMLCTRMSLGLDRLPLFLDEVGGGFDTTHNLRLGDFIRMLLSDYDCSNIFLVHHDIAVRNMLGPRDTIVFDATQVVVEPNYNEFVKLEYYKD